METKNLTSGVVTEVTLEAARTDGGAGDLYKVKIQGCELRIESSDFYRYTKGDRVAVLKTCSVAVPTTDDEKLKASKSFLSNDISYLKESNSYTKTLVINTDYVILPVNLYKVKE